MTEEEKEALKKEKQRLVNIHRSVRLYLERHQFTKAEEYAAKHGVTTAESRARSPFPLPYPMAQAPIQPPPEAARDASECINGWPIESPAEVWAGCRNRILVLVKLPDGRICSMLRQRSNWRLGTKLRVKLLEASGDPLYAPIWESLQE
jgi:hypothetical protein